MSTSAIADSRESEIEYDHDLHAFLCGLEADPSLFLPEQLRERLIALDGLDAGFGGFDLEDSTRCADSRIHQRAKALWTRLEAANAELYQSVRSDIVRGGQPGALLQWLQDSATQNESKSPLPGLDFDCRDEMVSGVLQLREPSEPNLQRSPEMVAYQPTPVRHILHLIAATALAEDDVFVDLGSGLGHVPLLVSMVTGAQSLGIEVQAAYVASARECAQSLHLSRVRFIPGRARSRSIQRQRFLSVFAFQRLDIDQRAERAANGEYAQVDKSLFTRALRPQSCERDMAEGARSARCGTHYRLRLSMSTLSPSSHSAIARGGNPDLRSCG